MAPGILKGVGKDGKAVRFQRPGRQGAVVIGGLCKIKDGRGQDSTGHGDGAERQRPDNVGKQVGGDCC